MTFWVTEQQGLVRVFHWGPLVALLIIKTIFLSSLSAILQWWPPTNSPESFLHFLLFVFWDVIVLYNFCSAVARGPGFVPRGWQHPEIPDEKDREGLPKSENVDKLLQYCQNCQCYKAPRAHHCRKCDKCVMKMDHHCPWINNCVGHKNHLNFTLFLIFAVCGCLHAEVPLCVVIWKALNVGYHLHHRVPGERLITLTLSGFMVTLLSIGLGLGVILAVGFLAYQQVRSIWRNRTGIEDWIVEKASYWRNYDGREAFIYPYDLGKWPNICEVFRSDRDGLWWPVRPGCDQFTLTREQLSQKARKRERAKEYEIQEAYSGAIFPLAHGWRVTFSPPCSDDPRIPLCKSDIVVVTRWKKHWLYGERVGGRRGDGKRLRGWFPRKIALEVAGAAVVCRHKKAQ